MLRRAVVDDIPRLMAIRTAVQENGLGDRRRASADDYQRRLPCIHVVEARGVTAGFACGDSATGNVWALFVDPAHEGQGYGRALLTAVVADLAAAGCGEAWLTTDPGTRAEGFYRHLGWRQSGTAGLGELRFVWSLRSARSAG